MSDLHWPTIHWAPQATIERLPLRLQVPCGAMPPLYAVTAHWFYVTCPGCLERKPQAVKDREAEGFMFDTTGPHRADTAFSRDIRRTTHRTKEPEMSNDTDGGKASERVRIPLGSPSQPTTKTEGNADRTELRSDATAENRLATRRPKVGDLLVVRLPERVPGDWYHVVVSRAPTTRPDGFAVATEDGEEHFGFSWDQEGGPWRWLTDEEKAELAAKNQAAVPSGRMTFTSVDLSDISRGPVIVAQGEVPAQPEPRHCTVHDMATEAACGTLLGRNLHCDVCGDASGAQKCFQHCGGVDHYGGTIVEQGGPWSLRWKVVEIAAGRFRGQVIRRQDGEVTIIATAHGVTVDEVKATLQLHLRRAEEGPLPTRTPRSSWQGPSGVRQVDALLNHPKLPPKVRTELVEEVIEWLRAGEQSWGDVYVTSYDTIDAVLEATKKWHDRQIAELFSRLAGAL